MRLQIKWVNGWAQLHGTGPDGRRVRRALKTKDPRRAEELRAAAESRLWQADLYGAGAVVTFDECALKYAEDGGEVRYLVAITEQLTGVKLRDITPSMVRDAARKAYPTAANSTVNRQAITPARAVINYGHAQGWCGAIKVKGFSVPKPKRRAVDRAYLDALRPHLPPRLFALMLFLHQTGRRVTEGLELTPEQVSGGRAFIPETKNGDAAWAHLTPELQDLIAEIDPRHGRVFGYVKRSSLYPTLRRACKKAGVEYLGTHQVGRHSFASTLQEAGWDAKAIAEAGGWKTTRMVSETYMHPVEPQARAAAVFGKKTKG
ncbi:tyrosine-type recombinase/integrase [Sulfitobacter faviae]|uniref:tyrosine-type recombinase/integrase n=1 Tax=Sulfitobacter faviae TaxID=1775881 RepID=UPI00398D43F5